MKYSISTEKNTLFFIEKVTNIKLNDSKLESSQAECSELCQAKCSCYSEWSCGCDYPNGCADPKHSKGP